MPCYTFAWTLGSIHSTTVALRALFEVISRRNLTLLTTSSAGIVKAPRWPAWSDFCLFDFRSRMSTSLAPCAHKALPQMRQLPEQSHIQVLEMNGSVLYSAVLERSYDTKLYCDELLRYILRQIHLPHCCAVIHWRFITTERSTECIGNLVWQALADDEYAALHPHTILLGTDNTLAPREEPKCLCCCLPCRDADVDDTRHENCVRCFPCWLCPECKVDMPNEPATESLCDYAPEPERPSYPVCFLCLHHDDVQTVLSRMSSLQRLRLRVFALSCSCPNLFQIRPAHRNRCDARLV